VHRDIVLAVAQQKDYMDNEWAEDFRNMLSRLT
jgi:hypothetical protein